MNWHLGLSAGEPMLAATVGPFTLLVARDYGVAYTFRISNLNRIYISGNHYKTLAAATKAAEARFSQLLQAWTRAAKDAGND